MAAATDTIRYHVTGMDCASCAAKIEGAARKVEGVGEVKVSIASQIMTLNVDDPQTRLPAIEQAVTSLGYQLDRIGQPKVAGAETDEDDDKIPDLSHVTPAYKRALWIVVLLNVGYGVIEIFGSFLSGSQALQADALDFVGDGLISFLGLIAVGWGLAARAKAALLQMTRTTAVIYAERGIRLNCVVPGLVFTPLVRRLADKYASGDFDGFVAQRHRQVPMGRMGSAWDVAHATLFLCSDQARYVTAQEIIVDGGISAATR